MSSHGDVPTVTLTPLHVGNVMAPQTWIFRSQPPSRLRDVRRLVFPGDRTMPMPLLAFLIRHPTAGAIVVDTGLHPKALTDLRSDYGLLNGLFFRTLRPAGQPFGEQLRQQGLETNDVRLVVMTHLHADHTSGMRLLPGARFVCSSAEWAAASTPGSARNGYVASHLAAVSERQLVDFACDGEQHGCFASTVDLLGDGTVRLISTPGHTHGHMSVLLRTASGLVLLIGDAVYTLRSLHEELLPMQTADEGQYLASVHQIKRFAQANPEAVLVPTHDERAWHQLVPERAA